MDTCQIRNCLEQLVQGNSASEPEVRKAASLALQIISEADEQGLSRGAADCLAALVVSIFRDSNHPVLVYLRDDSPDCNICEAMRNQI